MFRIYFVYHRFQFQYFLSLYCNIGCLALKSKNLEVALDIENLYKWRHNHMSTQFLEQFFVFSSFQRCMNSQLFIDSFSSHLQSLTCNFGQGGLKVVCINTWAPPWGWWSIILEWGKALRSPGDPLARSSEPILQACPMHHVATGASIYCNDAVKNIQQKK